MQLDLRMFRYLFWKTRQKHWGRKHLLHWKYQAWEHTHTLSLLCTSVHSGVWIYQVCV